MDDNIYNNFCNACKRNDKEIVKSMINTIPLDVINQGFRWACCNGHEDLIEFLIQHGVNNFNAGLSEACYNNQLKIAKLMISKGANTFHVGLYDSCRKRYKELVLLMLENGADINVRFHKLDFEDIYYLLQLGIKDFSSYNNIALECKKWKLEFQTTINELFITDVANIIVNF